MNNKLYASLTRILLALSLGIAVLGNIALFALRNVISVMHFSDF